MHQISASFLAQIQGFDILIIFQMPSQFRIKFAYLH